MNPHIEEMENVRTEAWLEVCLKCESCCRAEDGNCDLFKETVEEILAELKEV